MSTDLTLLDNPLFDVVTGDYFAACRYKNKGGFTSKWSNNLAFSKPYKLPHITYPTFMTAVDVTKPQTFTVINNPQSTETIWSLLRSPKFDSVDDITWQYNSRFGYSDVTATEWMHDAYTNILDKPDGTIFYLCVANRWDDNGTTMWKQSDIMTFTVTHRRENKPNIIRPIYRFSSEVSNGLKVEVVPPLVGDADVTIQKAIWYLYKGSYAEENLIYTMTSSSTTPTIPRSPFGGLAADERNFSLKVKTLNAIGKQTFWAESDVITFRVYA